MEGLTEMPEKLTRAEFEALYNKAASRVLARERKAAQDSVEEFAKVFEPDAEGNKS